MISFASPQADEVVACEQAERQNTVVGPASGRSRGGWSASAPARRRYPQATNTVWRVPTGGSPAPAASTERACSRGCPPARQVCDRHRHGTSGNAGMMQRPLPGRWHPWHSLREDHAICTYAGVDRRACTACTVLGSAWGFASFTSRSGGAQLRSRRLLNSGGQVVLPAQRDCGDDRRQQIELRAIRSVLDGRDALLRIPRTTDAQGSAEGNTGKACRSP